MGNSKIGIIVAPLAIVVLIGWFSMSSDDTIEGVTDDPAAVMESDTVDDQDADGEDDEDDDDN